MTMKAYSYIRFSTPEQRRGTSLERQQELAAAYAERNNLELDTSTNYHDLGVSGFKGKNRDAALGAFLNAVDKGDIESGSFLLVESLDRLSRDAILIALTQLTEIINLGITVVTLQDQRVFDKETLKDLGNLIVSLTIMSRANEESETKARRLRDAWSRKKAQARDGEHKLTKWCPAWLKLNDKRNGYESIGDRVEIVRRIYSMTIDGIGYVKIAATFNQEGIPVFGRSNGWHHSYIHKILQNEAVIGNYQPMRDTKVDGKRKRINDGEPIVGYYPAIIERGDFLEVQALRSGKRKPRGRTGGTFSNLLSGLVTCGTCGGPVHFIGKGKPPKGRPYYQCSNSRRFHGNCTAPSFRYEPIEAFVVRGVAEVDLSSVFPEKSRIIKLRLTALQKERLTILDDKQRRGLMLNNAIDQLLLTPSDALRNRMEELEAENRQTDEALTRLDTEINELQKIASTSSQAITERQSLLSKWNEAQQAQDVEILYNLRAKLNQSLKDTIQSIIMQPNYDEDSGESTSVSLWVSLKGDTLDHVWSIDVWKEGVRGFTGRANKMFSSKGDDGGVIWMEWSPTVQRC